jgi:FAD/FMN-containing dehydrogenase
MNPINVQTVDHKNVELRPQVVDSLVAAIRGQVLDQHHPAYASARVVWNGMIDKKPGMIVQCRGAADVMAAVKFASEHRLRTYVRGGGHNVAGACMDDDSYTIDLSSMRTVHVDPEKRTARVEGGARLGDLDHETQAFGLAAPVGVVSETGVSGLTLHGGMGWLLRKYGLSLDNLVSVDVVTADGQLRRADRDHNSDLFWAVRGGGGSFGVVTAFEFKLYPIGPEVWLSVPIYPIERATEVVRRFRDYMQTAPDELMGLSVYWSAPEALEVPQQYHGRPVVILLGCYTGPFEQGEKIIAPLRQIGTPIADLSGPMQWKAVQRFLDADYPDGDYYYWKSIYLDRLDDQVIQTLSDHHALRPSALSSIDVWTLGRAMNRVNATETAFYKRDAPFMIGIEANWKNRNDSDSNIEWARGLYTKLEPFSHGGNYLNFPGLFEEQQKMLHGAFGPNLERLKAIKAKYDPANLFAGAINISPVS